MKNISITVIFIFIICSSFALHIDDDIWDNNSSDINFHHDIYNIYSEYISFIEEENDLNLNLNKREQKNTKQYKKEKNEDKNFDIKVSVIIPTYNSEKFIGRCIESAVNQTLKEIEILVVDDCSNDSTISIIDEYKKKDDRIKPFVNKVNSGVGISRNKALKEATGEFVGFIDADDYVDPGWYQNLYDNSKNMDLVRGIRVMHEFSDTYRKSRRKPYGCIVPSIIRKSFLDKYKIKFPKFRKFEDSYFNELVKMKKPRTKLLPDNGIYYHYIIREGSLSNYTNPNKNNTTNEIENPTQTISITTIETTEPSDNVDNTSNINEGNSKFNINMIEGLSIVKTNVTSITIISIILVIGAGSYFIIKKIYNNKEKENYEKLEEANGLLESKKDENEY